MDDQIIAQTFGFATYPSVLLKGDIEDKKGKKKFGFLKQLLFGDFIQLLLDKDKLPVFRSVDGKEYIHVRARNRNGYIRSSEIQLNRILEVNFIDVGQGDGCHIVTPEDQHILVDAGPTDNMYRFLRWRFNLRTRKPSPRPLPEFTVVISHSDEDHYGGFNQIFSTPVDGTRKLPISKVFHNGMIELSGTTVDTLGTAVVDNIGKYISDLCDDEQAFQTLFNGSGKKGNYINTLKKTSAPKEALRKGSPPLYDQNGLTIDVLGPIAQNVRGKDALPVFGDSEREQRGKTKNGHSIILKLSLGNVRLLLGGDLNESAEDYLLKQYTGTDLSLLRQKLKNQGLSETEKEDIRQQVALAIDKARETFEVDIAKSCHHGSSDFTSEFMRALNPLATVISSGDEESYAHPRPDTLGTIGKFSRGERSLIFSTELSRSSPEFIDLTKKIKKLRATGLLKPGPSDTTTGKQKKQSDTDLLERVVTVYGMINVRTDGQRIIIAQKLEKNAANSNWDIHKLVWNSAINEFEYLF